MRALVFARCAVCTHAALQRAGAACKLCGGEPVEAPTPPDLYDGWRCGCYQCTWTPC